MTWSTISGPGTTTATKFHGDALNKVSNLFNGTDVSDTVTIHANTLVTVGNQTMTGRFQTDKGADVASPAGGIMTLGADGNVFDITGTNTINEILATSWTVGAQITLQFDGILTVTHNSGGTNDILLGNAANMTTAAGNTLTLFFNGTDWVEISRNIGDGSGDMVLASVQTVTGAKTFGSAGAVGKLIVAGTTSGSTIIDATATAGSGTVTLPTTGTLATLGGAETLSGVKTFSAAPVFQDAVKIALGTGSDSTLVDTGALVIFDYDEANVGSRSFDIQSDATSIALFNDTIATFSVPIDVPDVETTTISARDGTLAQSIANSTGVTTFVSGAVLVAPVLGTPAAGSILTNCTGLPAAGLVATTINRALVSDASGVIIPATTTDTEIGYVNGVTSAIQTQMDLKSPLASPTFTGTVTTAAVDVAGNNIDNIKGLINNVETVASSATLAFDFATENLAKITSLAHAPTITTSNRVEGAKKRILIISDATPRALTFSESWKWITDVPTTTEASKNYILTLECLGTATTDVWAAWAAQP